MRYIINSAIMFLLVISGTALAQNSIRHDEYADLGHQTKQLATQRKDDAAKQNRIDSQVFNRQSLILDTDRDQTDIVLRRTVALLEHLTNVKGVSLPDERIALAEMVKQNDQISVENKTARKDLFDRIVKLRRQIAFSNPLLDFDRILFLKRHFNPEAEKTGNHMCDQYFGFHAIRGGGIFVLENPFSDDQSVKNILEDSVCKDGRLKGKKMTDQGGYLSPELSFDGSEILFAYTDIADDPKRYEWNQDNTWHIFRVGVDGTNLRQITDGNTNDFDPCWLPSGRIAFISERRGGYGRCHGRPVPSFTLHSMNVDGSDIVRLSPHETNEWHPSVDNNGMIVYTRWDYVDRGFNNAHHPWSTTPDGRDSRSIHGNFAASDRDRPHMEMDIRAIPGSDKLIATAACHHGQAYGSVVIIDPKVEDDNAMAPVRRVTPEQLFPEAENKVHLDPVNYCSVWPLSENFYLCVYDAASKSNAGTDNNYGIYLLDAFGNRELLYRDPKISCLNPIPLRPREKPPVIPHATLLGKPLAKGEKFVPIDPKDIPKTAQIGVVNVYDSQNKLPEGTKIKSLRIIQLLPKITPIHNDPRIGHGDQKSARAVLGTVPVEDDGSASFNMPVGIPVYMQAIDQNGLAIQSMRSATYVHPGENLLCQGCHENRHNSPVTPKSFPMAFKRAPSKITPDVEGSKPFSYPRLVQPVLDKNCVGCHEKNKDKNPPNLTKGNFETNGHYWYTSYENLREHIIFFDNGGFTIPKTIPGKFGAHASKLYQMLAKGHHDLKLSEEDMHRITLWLDCNADFYGSYQNTLEQAKGEIIQPALE